MPRRQAHPGLDADEGSLRLRRVPEGNVVHVRVRDLNRVRILISFERHGSGRALQYDGVVVEEAVTQFYGVIFERIGYLLAGNEILGREQYLLRLAGL